MTRSRSLPVKQNKKVFGVVHKLRQPSFSVALFGFGVGKSGWFKKVIGFPFIMESS